MAAQALTAGSCSTWTLGQWWLERRVKVAGLVDVGSRWLGIGSLAQPRPPACGLRKRYPGVTIDISWFINSNHANELDDGNVQVFDHLSLISCALFDYGTK
jgi:hypothetical protein